MKITLAIILLSIMWLVFSGDFSLRNFFFGNIIGYFIMWLVSIPLGNSGYFKKFPKIIALLIFFLKELFVANLKVAYEIITVHKHSMKPGIIKVPLDLKSDFQITFLANLITLTPGTLTMDVSPDKKFIYVHSMYIENRDEAVRNIKEGFEKRIMDAFE